MDDLPLPGVIPARVLRPGLNLQQVKTLLRNHGVTIRSVDNHHWQISQGWRSALWMTGEGKGGEEAGLEDEALERLALVLRHSGLLREEPPGLPPPTPSAASGAAAGPAAPPLEPVAPPPLRPMRAAILWIGFDATRVYWVNDLALAQGSALSLGHWLHQEFTLHRCQRSVPYLRRIVAMLERIERVLLIGPRPPGPAAQGSSQEHEHEQEPKHEQEREPGQGPGLGQGPGPGQASAQGQGPAQGQGQSEGQGGGSEWGNRERGNRRRGAPLPSEPLSDPPAKGEGVVLLNQLLEQLRPDLRRRVVGVISLEGDQLDDALLFTIARTYLLAQGGAPPAG